MSLSRNNHYTTVSNGIKLSVVLVPSRLDNQIHPLTFRSTRDYNTLLETRVAGETAAAQTFGKIGVMSNLLKRSCTRTAMLIKMIVRARQV